MEEMIKALPKRSSILLKEFPLYKYQGHWSIQEFVQGTVSAQQNFKAHSTDIFLCSCPKTGTTWLKALAFAIVTRKKFDKSNNPLLTTVPHDCVPFLEKDLDKIHNNSGDSPLVGTHLPYSSLPESVISSDCKIVYIYRNTKDVVVSNYHFARKFSKSAEEEAPFEKAFAEFYEGFSAYGPYWDHILGYWKASLERPERILFLKYEDMKMDALENVKKLAEFMGYPFSIEEINSGVVEDIVKLCSFENLSNLEVNKTGRHREKETTSIENNLYFRKAEVGDWENYFTEEMKEKLDKLMSEKLSGTGLDLS